MVEDDLEIVDTDVHSDIGKVEKNMVGGSVGGDKGVVILEDTPVVLHRLRKPATVCESPYLSKFDFGCRNVLGKPAKCIEKGHSSK